MTRRNSARIRWIAAGIILVQSGLPERLLAQTATAPLFKISASLTWESPYVGDPLRVRVRLTHPQIRQAAALQMRQIEQGQPVTGSAATPPPVTTNWYEGVSLNLYRVNANNTRQLVLPADQWPPFLRPLLAEPPVFDGLTTARSREWLIPAVAAGLHAGSYVLTAGWNGTHMTDPGLLPPTGVVAGQELSFTVTTHTDPTAQATHLGRLAYQEYMSGDLAQARAHSQAALRLDPQNRDRERIETHFVAAHAALRMQDYLGSADALQTLVQTYSGLPGDEVVEVANQRLEFLAPRLQVPPGASLNQNAFPLQVLSLPNQHYITYASPNLQTWLPFSTNVGSGTWIDVLDTNRPMAGQRFYRSIWTP
jgi:hypothetical protein